jgi:23S rRNA A1618 N6-methylase RlmF
VLSQCGANQVEVIPMRQGQKVSRLLAWRFKGQVAEK